MNQGEFCYQFGNDSPIRGRYGGPFDEQPLRRPRPFAPVVPVRRANPQAGETRPQALVASLPPSHRAPSLRRQGIRQRRDRERPYAGRPAQGRRRTPASRPATPRQGRRARRPDRGCRLDSQPILFIYGWNQYLWPLLITTDESMYTILIGINRMLAVGDAQAEWQIIMATTMLAMLPPVAVVILMQRLFVKGLVETEK